MRIGIVTVHSVPNYGAVLQAYALAEYLRSQRFNVRTIDYRQPHLEQLYRLEWKFPPQFNHWLRLRRNSRFVKTHLPLSRAQYRSVEDFVPDIGDYDAFITGSDQVWFTGPVQGFDPMYFLDFHASGKRKISYAASVGGTVDFGVNRVRVENALAQFDHVAVRDAHSAELVAPLLDRDLTLVVDPVFLSDFGELLPEQPPVAGPYVLVFGDFGGSLLPVLQNIIKATGIRKVISLQYPCAAATHRIPAPSPQVWLSYFRHASFVVTSYFHGTAIAVKFERPFLALPTPGRRIKVKTLLEPLGLRNRCFETEPSPLEAASRCDENIDWPFAQQQLKTQICQSQSFLQSALQ